MNKVNGEQMEEDGLHRQHRISTSSEVLTQKDKAKDLRLIFTDKVQVTFIKDNSTETPHGHWCNICKNDDRFVKKHRKCKVFHTGGNSSC
ncbi:hypothetical protein L208DRAFT_1521562 [Tricholoma matsutake]|nr:hypothetical protein L208DRAFT_1521562 [Tricholoma matsutake 945]